MSGLNKVILDDESFECQIGIEQQSVISYLKFHEIARKLWYIFVEEHISSAEIGQWESEKPN